MHDELIDNQNNEPDGGGLTRDRAAVLDKLPPPWPEEVISGIREHNTRANHSLVVLDDDPTGTQTVYDVPVLTTGSTEALREEFARATPLFYILTNSRALPADQARALNQELATNLLHASRATGRAFSVYSRSDSTLRGHFPLETDTLAEVLGGYDRLILCPYFAAGGRLTIDDIHYVAEGDQLIPAAQTPFAQDAAFGFKNSQLRAWVEEKSGGKIPAASVASLSLERIRGEGPDGVAEYLQSLPKGAVCILNAVIPEDVEVAAAGILQAEASGIRFLYRGAAQLVAALGGIRSNQLLPPEKIRRQSTQGGLTVVGSYVAKTATQLETLQSTLDLPGFTLDVPALLEAQDPNALISALMREVNRELNAGRDCILATSRQLIRAETPEQSLAIGQKVSDAMVACVRQLAEPPAYLIAKGGITSSDIATKALGIERAMVQGQLLPGVPVWRTGTESRYPGISYVIFPGNVGDANALAEAVLSLRKK